MGSLTPLESVCLSETLLRATFHAELAESEAVPTLSASAADHPTKLAERWVADYVPLPVDGTVSIAYSTGVVIQFSEFTPLLQPLAVANAEHRERMLKTISSCYRLVVSVTFFFFAHFLCLFWNEPTHSTLHFIFLSLSWNSRCNLN